MKAKVIRKLSRAIQVFDRFVESTNQVGLVNSLKIFSYLAAGGDKKRSILVERCSAPFCFYPRADKGVMSHLYKLGYHIKGNAGLVFDVGANIGDETLRFRYFHPSAEIVAIEASARNYELLRDNFTADPMVHPIHGALWHEDGFLQLQKGDSFESFRLAQSDFPNTRSCPEETVQSFTVDRLLNKFGFQGRHIDIFKIDIEGAEEYVFCSGSLNWMKLVNEFIMEMPDNDRPGSFQKIMAKFLELGIHGDSYICGENFIFIRKDAGFELVHLVGLGA
ncbi:FkbM family methyltransferase [Cyanobium sp. Aljojuca 7D2]|uniref:FkbM family methyltransferase n=1 Tax=Cyanobium sp. Aljojuca 7D2 TaxID=2823698 RepID=UPI0020CDEF48|nr:FkbM family methyltransferase [Cyanobium sp. Aljojuca 7D2]MCP9890276.1 FkbM family methyltransferase [Cyanobium sp. Aljojuca 7D2]